jgi:hypothetical protein
MSASGKDEAPILAVAWYKPSQWQRLEEIAPDVKEAWGSYEQWHAAATRRINETKRAGRRAEKVELDVEELLAWCRQQDRPVDAATRAEYAAALLAKRLDDSSG